MHRGYIKLWRKIEDTAIFSDSHAVHVLLYLLINAARHDRCLVVGTRKVELRSGQLVTGRKAISRATGINESKVFRVLELLKSEQLIEQQANNKFSIISICNWQLYQNDEQQTEHQVNNKRTSNEHKQEVKEVKKELYCNKNNPSGKSAGGKPKRFTPPSLEEVSAFCSERNNGIDASTFIDFYAARGWLIGKNQMKDWKAAVRTWESRRKEKDSKSQHPVPQKKNPLEGFKTEAQIEFEKLQREMKANGK